MEGYKFSIQSLARWLILIVILRAAWGVLIDDLNGRPATAPVEWPQAVAQNVIGLAIVYAVFWVAGMFSGLLGDGDKQ